MTNLLERRALIEPAPFFTQNQLQMDALSHQFAHEATNPVALAAMVGGSLSYRFSHLLLGRALSPVLTGNGLFTKFAAQAGIKLLSLGVEVSVFSGISHPDSPVFSRREWTREFINFGLMKSVGHASRGLNVFANHALQAGSMVLGHQFAYRLGLDARPEGSIAQQWVQAEAMILQMNAGLGILHSLSGGRLALFETRLDHEIRLIQSERNPLPASLLPLPLIWATEGPVTGHDPTESADRHAWTEAIRERKIIERNGGVLHDVGKVLSSPILTVATMVKKIQSAALVPEVETLLSREVTNLYSLLSTLNSLFETGREKSREFLETVTDTETFAVTAARDTDNILLTLQQTIALFPDINTACLRLIALVERHESLRGNDWETRIRKTGTLVQKAEAFIQEQERKLRGLEAPAIVRLADIFEEAWLLSETERRSSRIQTERPELPSPDIYVHINQYSLMASLLNLLVNACHAMRKSAQGALILRARTQQREEGEYVVIEVQDTGTGIADEHRPYLFDPHFTTKPRADEARNESSEPLGTGMGLYMVNQMVRKYGGKIELESQVGDGSLFRIYLRRFDPTHGLAEHIPSEGRISLTEIAPVLGRRYTQINLQNMEREFRELATLIQADAEGAVSSAEKGRFLAQVAQHLLLTYPYPDCQRYLIRLHRILELAYVRLDFELIQSYRGAINPEVNQYMNHLATLANQHVSPEGHLVPLDAMRLDLPGAYVIPHTDHMRANFATQFGQGNGRTVYDTEAFFTSEQIPTLAQAFTKTFHNRMTSLIVALQMLQRMHPEKTIDDLLTEEFEDAHSRTYQATLKKGLSDTREYARILNQADSDYHQRLLQYLFYHSYNIVKEYSLLYQTLSSLNPSVIEREGFVLLPSLEEINSRLPENRRRDPDAVSTETNP